MDFKVGHLSEDNTVVVKGKKPVQHIIDLGGKPELALGEGDELELDLPDLGASVKIIRVNGTRLGLVLLNSKICIFVLEGDE